MAGLPLGGSFNCAALAVIDSGGDFHDGLLLFAGILLPLGVGFFFMDGVAGGAVQFVRSHLSPTPPNQRPATAGDPGDPAPGDDRSTSGP